MGFPDHLDAFLKHVRRGVHPARGCLSPRVAVRAVPVPAGDIRSAPRRIPLPSVRLAPGVLPGDTRVLVPPAEADPPSSRRRTAW
ncbi:hypothetical protein SMA5143A_7895 [Streptomyces sp. MA5143a]|nr:hypothetical protein SMA5143A_7895 [Streptomyces sp. MA5143a]